MEELQQAIKSKKKVYTFIAKEVYTENKTYEKNISKGSFEPAYADNIKIHEFISGLKFVVKDNPILPFESIDDIIGQERAVKAFDFGLEVKMKGYNIYMAGPTGTGKTTLADAVAGDITAAIPYRTMTNILEFIKALDNVVPGFASADNLLYSPEIKFYFIKNGISDLNFLLLNLEY